MRACEEALSRHVDWSLEDVLRGAEGAPSLERVEVVQPALFAVLVSLAALWRSFGVEPSVVVGHSQGEVFAAHVAGGLSLDDAARVVVQRSGIASRTLIGRGAMAALALPADEAERRLERFDGRLSVAVRNGPRSVSVAGDCEPLDELVAECKADGIRARRIPATWAGHSPQVEAIREPLLEALAAVEPRSGDVPFYSTATGALVDTAELGAEYWYRNSRQPVQFEQVTRALLDDGFTAFVETSPHPVLTMAIEEIVEDAGRSGEVATIGSLRREEGGLDRFVTSLCEAWVAGVEVDLRPLLEGGRRAELPTYAFQHERYWVHFQQARGDGSAGLAVLDQPMPGERESGGSLARRLAAIPRDEWGAALLDAIGGEVAAVLGAGAPKELDPDQPLLELGFNSLSAVELRNRLGKASGLKLPSKLAFDHPTPAGIAGYLAERLAKEAGAGDGASAPADGADGADGAFGALLRQAQASGTTLDALRLLADASRFQPAFESAAELDEPPRPVRLATGDAAPALICIPSFVLGSGAHQFARFAGGLSEPRNVWALPLPGFRGGEPLPASWSAAVETLAEAVRGVADGEPYALVGYSGGGALAHAVAERLEHDGESPAGLVLIDTYAPEFEELAEAIASVIGQSLDRAHEFVPLDDRSLLAMGAYMRLFADWEPGSIEAQTALIRASEPLGDAWDEDGRLPSWQVPETVVEVQGDHFGVIEQGAEATAREAERLVVEMVRRGSAPVARSR
jgi:malonyl CoA-acyl carrier protein transacylase/thioesterase domain-containing protein/acyl carrier protein